MSKVLTFPTQEIFGPAIQGEGNEAGRKTIFVRLAGCDFNCSWCDTKETWKITNQQRLTAIEMVNRIMELGTGKCNHVTFTGGNPALYDLTEVIDLLHENKYFVSMETQGSKWQDWFLKIDNVVISPKGPSSGMNQDFNFLKTIVNQLIFNNITTVIKTPIFNDEDFEFYNKLRELLKEFPECKFYLSVGNSDPDEQGSIQERILDRYRWLIDKVIESNMEEVYVLPQLHTLVWGNKKGV